MRRANSFVVGVVVSAVLSGCSAPLKAGSTTFPATTSASPSSTTSSTPPDAGRSTTTTTLPPDPTTAVVAAWGDFWSAWADLRASANPVVDPIEEVAAPAVVASVLTVLERQIASSGPVETEIATRPSVRIASRTSATLEDCVLLVPSITESVGVWYLAELEDDGTGWKVVSLQIEDPTGCVPAEVADEAISAYQSYYEAEAEFWNPPDPDDQLIADVLANPQRAFVMALLADHEARGVGFRNAADHHPEVIEVRSATELVILDCYELAADYGLYDLESGERLSDELEVRPGQRNLRSAVMVFEDGRWKASDFQGQVDLECEFAPTERGLPSA